MRLTTQPLRVELAALSRAVTDLQTSNETWRKEIRSDYLDARLVEAKLEPILSEQQRLFRNVSQIERETRELRELLVRDLGLPTQSVMPRERITALHNENRERLENIERELKENNSR